LSTTFVGMERSIFSNKVSTSPSYLKHNSNDDGQ